MIVSDSRHARIVVRVSNGPQQAASRVVWRALQVCCLAGMPAYPGLLVGG